LLRRPSLLILDEATSALDRANSDRIVETLNALKEDCAILVITHNPAIARCAGQIVELLEGEVINTQPKP
jgi:ATP-binding cassette subfamily C protein